MKRVFFDLDGTLTDSSEGIFNSILYAVKKLGYREPTLAELRSFVGPPLRDSFQQLYGLSEEAGQQAVETYRENYRVSGVNEFTVYPGIPETLAKLAKEYELYVATSKPEFFAKKVIHTAGLETYFTDIFGADFDNLRGKKAQVIRYGLEQLVPMGLNEMVMVGDRAQDILGAKENGLRSIGVLFGFGSREELVAAGADWIIEKPEELLDIVRSAEH